MILVCPKCGTENPITDRYDLSRPRENKEWIPAKARRVFKISSISAGEYNYRKEEGDLP